jgi:mRNA interferase RelE/StbE
MRALTALGDDPYREDADVRMLTGPSGLCRLRVGGYRDVHRSP